MSRKGAEVTSTPARLTLLRVGGFRASHYALHLSLPHFGSLSETSLLQEATETTGGENLKSGRRESQTETAGTQRGRDEAAERERKGIQI